MLARRIGKSMDTEMLQAAFLGDKEKGRGVSSGKEPVLSADAAGAGLGWVWGLKTL